MATISQIQINGTTYEIADAAARDSIASFENSFTWTTLSTTTATSWYTKGSNTNITSVTLHYNKFFVQLNVTVTTAADISLPAGGNHSDIFMGQIIPNTLRPLVPIPLVAPASRGWFAEVDSEGSVYTFAVNGTGTASTFSSGSSLNVAGFWPRKTFTDFTV